MNPELVDCLQRIRELRAREERIGVALVKLHARVAVLTGDREAVRDRCRFDAATYEHQRDYERVGVCVVCGDDALPHRATCSHACWNLLRGLAIQRRRGRAAAASGTVGTSP